MAAFPKLWYTYHLWYAKDSQVVRLPSRNLIYFFININECKIQSFSLNFIKIKILHNNFDLLCLFLYCYHTLLLVSRSMWVLDVLHLLHQLRAPVQVNRKFAKKCKSQPIQNRIYWSKNVTQHGKVCHGPIALVHRSAHVIKLNIYINGVKLNKLKLNILWSKIKHLNIAHFPDDFFHL